MKRGLVQPEEKKELSDAMKQKSFVESPSFETASLVKTGLFSLVLHATLIAFLVMSLRASVTKPLSFYRVTLRPYAPAGAMQSKSPGGDPEGVSAALKKVKVDKATKETVRDSKAMTKEETSKRAQKNYEQPLKNIAETAEKGKRDTESKKSLQRALEDIRRKAALDAIQKRIALRETGERQKSEGQTLSQRNQDSLSSETTSGERIRSGTKPGVGIGTGEGGYPMEGVPWGSPEGSPGRHSKLDDYYSLMWSRIKKEWTLPEDFQGGNLDLETIIVVVIDRQGNIKKTWFEKSSGNVLYDQMAMRAVKKSEPFPPIPKEFTDNTFEIGIRFHPD